MKSTESVLGSYDLSGSLPVAVVAVKTASAVAYRHGAKGRWRRWLRRDLAVGIVVSVLFHAGLAFSSRYFVRRPPEPVKQQEQTEIYEIPITPIEPETVDDVENTEEAGNPDLSDLAPPMQADVPTLSIDSPFTQALQPPPPPGIKVGQMMKLPGSGVGAGGGIGHGMMALFNLDDLDQQPMPTFRPAPAFPADMKRNGTNGEVLIGFVVDANGNVREPYILRSSRYEFESAAMEGVLRWRFRPGMRAGRAVNTRMVVPISFTLDH